MCINVLHPGRDQNVTNVFISIFCNTSQALASVMLVMTNSSVIKTEFRPIHIIILQSVGDDHG